MSEHSPKRRAFRWTPPPSWSDTDADAMRRVLDECGVFSWYGVPPRLRVTLPGASWWIDDLEHLSEEKGWLFRNWCARRLEERQADDTTGS
jgi:hypothetical protein